jgi:predicted RNase H-like HicB family nuclease
MDPLTAGQARGPDGQAGERPITLPQHIGRTYSAEARELPGRFASGDTVAGLIESFEEAVSLYLAPPEGEARPVAIELAGLTSRWSRISRCSRRRRHSRVRRDSTRFSAGQQFL